MAIGVGRKADLYEKDFYVWTERQADLLRARRFEDLDLENLIEEVEALGRSERNAVLSNAGVIIEHLLKLQHSPANEPRAGWRATSASIAAARGGSSRPGCAGSSRTSCPASTPRSAPTRRSSYATMASTPLPMRCPTRVPTRWTS